MGKKFLFLVLLVVTGGLAVGAYLATPEVVPGPTLANFERPGVGASLQEVEAALGPPDHASVAHLRAEWGWSFDDGLIAISFSAGRAKAGFARFGGER